MRYQLCRHRCILLFVTLLLLAATASAQSGDPVAASQAPVPGVGHHYIGIGVETVNPADGSLTFDLPIQTPPGRMLSFPFGIHYSSAELSGAGTPGSWGPQNAPPDDFYGWSFGLPTYVATATVTGSAPGPACQPFPSCQTTNYCWGASGYIFTSTLDGKHPVSASNEWADPRNNMNIGCSANGGGGGGGNGLYATFAGATGAPRQPPINFTNRQGTVYGFSQGPYSSNQSPAPWSMIAQTITDRNGNQLSLTGQNLYLGVGGPLQAGYYTDTLGRKVVSWTGIASTTGDQITISGMSTPVILKWFTNNTFKFPVETYFVTGTYNGPSCSEASSTQTASLTTATELDLPNGQKYSFVYGGPWGRLTKIVFPDGGYVRYVWNVNQNAPSWNSTNNSSAAQTNWVDFNGNNQSCYYTYDTLKITDRYVSFDGSTEVLHQSFSYSTNWTTAASGQPTWSSKTTTVTTTDLLTNQLTTTTYTYNSIFDNNVVVLGCTGGACGNSYTGPRMINQIPVEVSVSYQDSSSHTVRTVNKSWADQYGMIGEQTILDNGQGVTTLRCLDRAERVLASYQYGFQSEGAKPADPSCSVLPAAPQGATLSYGLNTSAIGPLRRQTATAYHTFSSSSTIDAPDSVTVYDGSNNQLQQTTFAYDAGTVAPSGAQTGLVAPPGSRGNPTSVSHWLNTTGTSLTTTYTYYDTGQVASMNDPCGNATCTDMTGSNHTTTYSYADNYATGTPPGQTNAYLTTATYPTPSSGVAQVEKFSWNYAYGLIASRTDRNSQTTNFYYSDPLLRLPKSTTHQTRTTVTRAAKPPTRTMTRSIRPV